MVNFCHLCWMEWESVTLNRTKKAPIFYRFEVVNTPVHELATFYVATRRNYPNWLPHVPWLGLEPGVAIIFSEGASLGIVGMLKVGEAKTWGFFVALIVSIYLGCQVVTLSSNNPRCSMYGLFTYIWVVLGVNVGKYTIHWASGNGKFTFGLGFPSLKM